MSDLQCPATVLVLRDEVPVDVLRAHRVATVVSSATRAGTAQELAAAVGAPVVRRELGDLGAALEELGDLHRGETLLVVVEPAVAEDLLTRVLGPATARGVRDEPFVELALDADGWALRQPRAARPGETGASIRDWKPE